MFIARNFSDSVFGIICAESTSDFCRTFPLAHVHRRSRKWLALLILAAWLFAILVSILPLLGVNTCRQGVPCDSVYTLPKEYTIVTNIVLISSLIVNFFLYVRVVHKALSHSILNMMYTL